MLRRPPCRVNTGRREPLDWDLVISVFLKQGREGIPSFIAGMILFTGPGIDGAGRGVFPLLMLREAGLI